MGNFLNNTANLFFSMEEVYAAKNRGLDRKAFLMAACGSKGEGNQLDSIKSKVLSEYNDSPELAGKLGELLDRLEILWPDIVEVKTIANLDELVSSVLTTGKLPAVDENIVAGLYPFELLRSVPKPVDLEQALKTSTFVSDSYVGMKDGSVAITWLNNLSKDEEFFLFKAGFSARVFMKEFDKNEFIKRVYPIVETLSSQRTLPKYCLIVGKSNFNKRNDNVTVHVGDEKFQARILDTSEYAGMRILSCEYISESLPIPVLCIS